MRQDLIKKCPFCGVDAKVNAVLFTVYNVACNSCKGNSGNYKTEAEAIEAWNKRVNLTGEP